MKRTTSLVLAVLIPATALSAELIPNSRLDAAKELRTSVPAAATARQQAADAAASGDATPPAALPVERARPRAEGSAAAADGGRGAVPAPDTYTIRPGDTLWDLSGRFLNNPWYWPKVWSFNPEINNPHWIEPGNVLKFYPSAEEAPARVEATAAATPGMTVSPEAAEEAPAEPPRELEDFSRADLKAPASVEEGEEVDVAGPYKIGYVPPRSIMARRDTFVTPREVEESGSLVAAFEEKLMLSTADRAYARFKRPADLQPGETYVVYRTDRPIYTPSPRSWSATSRRSLGRPRRWRWMPGRSP